MNNHRPSTILDKISFVRYRLLSDGVISAQEWPEVRREFFRFIALAKAYGKPIAMVSPKIDALWHQFILFTEEYSHFCDKHVGFFFHHSPNTPTTRVAVEALSNFFITYFQRYGSPPKIWFDGLNEVQKARATTLQKACELATGVGSIKNASLKLSETLKWSGWVPSSKLHTQK